MVRCPNCRMRCEDAAAFCPRCGMNLKEDRVAAKQAPFTYSPGKKFPLHVKSFDMRRRLVVLGAVFLVLLLGGLWLINRSQPEGNTTVSAPAQQGQAQGTFWFYTHKSQNDSVALSLTNLRTLPAGQQYVAWLSNPRRPNQYLLLSALKPDAKGTVTLRSEQIPSFNKSGSDLPVVYIKLLVTRELTGTLQAHPSQAIILQGTLGSSQPLQMQALIFGSDGLPGGVSLAADLQARMLKLEQRMQDLENAQKKHDVSGAQRQARRILYLLEGKLGSDVSHLKLAGSSIVKKEGNGVALSEPDCQVGQATCGYLERLRASIQGLTNAQGITDKQRQELLTMLNTLTTQARTARQQVIPLATKLTLSQADSEKITKLVQTLRALQSGTDLNGNGKIDPVAGEVGAQQFEQRLQQVGAVKLSTTDK